MAGVARIAWQTSTAVIGPVTTSTMTSWWSAARAIASAGSVVTVTV